MVGDKIIYPLSRSVFVIANLLRKMISNCILPIGLSEMFFISSEFISFYNKKIETCSEINWDLFRNKLGPICEQVFGMYK